MIIIDVKFRQIIRDYFSFSRGERVGLTILIVLMILVSVADRLIFYFETPATADPERFSRVLAALEQEEVAPKPVSLFCFDPNTIDSAALDSLALPQRIRQNMLRYRLHGGVFKRKEDLRRIYGMNDSVFAAIAGFMVIQESKIKVPVMAPGNTDQKEAVETNRSGLSAPVVVRVELNTATAGDLIQLPGIGPVLSGRIIRYRNLLGGFHSVAQLKEVYGLTPETIKRIEGQLDIDSTRIATLNINFSDAAELAKHFYLDRDHAGRIIEYRTKNGFIRNKFQLLHDSVLPAEIFVKVHPYLQTSD
ncbi:MAG: helix-hairpin-helix domain-containing protein [Prolixibacteraceae bacterium]